MNEDYENLDEALRGCGRFVLRAGAAALIVAALVGLALWALLS